MLRKSRFLDCGPQKLRPSARNDSCYGLVHEGIVRRRCRFARQQIAKDETVAMDDFAGANGNGPAEDGTVKDKSMKFPVFAAGIGVGRKIAKERVDEFTTGETGSENFGIDAGGHGTEMFCVEGANEFARVALPDGEKSGHAHARKVFLAIGAQVFQEDVAKGDFAYTLIVEDAQSLLHARLVDGIDALRWDAHFVQRQADGFGLLEQEFATDAVHADAVVAVGDSGEESRHAELWLLEQRVQGHGAVFAAAPAEEDGFG